MTSEVVLMNNKAVAVAADSVVTVAVDGIPRKTYTGVNKLFEVGEGRPVAMMIYSNAELMGLPWKTVINTYKQKSGNPKFGSVQEYADDFFRFLDEDRELFSEQQQRDQYTSMLRNMVNAIESRASAIRKFIVADQGDASAPASETLIAMAVGQIYDRVTLDDWDEPREDLTCFPAGFNDRIVKTYEKEINEIVGRLVAQHALSDATIEKLRELPYLIVTKHYFPQGWPYSGLVFAGYGDGQVHPELCSYEVSNMVAGILKRGDHIFTKLNNEEPVVIQPFAQDRMIRTLLYGIDPYLESHIIHKTFELVPRLMDQILGAIPDLSDSQLEHVLRAMQEEEVSEAINDFFQSIFHHQAMHHMVPIYSAIQALPEHELAQTAASLVNLNSFQQQVSLEVETVGGDIDVALMTPTDGFMWVNKPKNGKQKVIG